MPETVNRKTTIIEFLDSEPIENVITSINYEVDKVIFVGYKEAIDYEKSRVYSTYGSDDKVIEAEEKRDSFFKRLIKRLSGLFAKKKNSKKCCVLDGFLKEVCGVNEICYIEIPRNDLQEIVRILKETLDRERMIPDNHVFFDTTGGEEVAMIAFGILSTMTRTPMHMYDIKEGVLIEIDAGAEESISKFGKEKELALTVEALVRLHGGCVRSHVDLNENGYTEIIESAGFEKIKAVLKERISDAGDVTDENADEAVKKLYSMDLNGLFVLHEIAKIRAEGGSDILLNAVLDWDGIIQSEEVDEANNYITVLSVNNYALEFSFFATAVQRNKQRNNLYKLDTIAKRFGGKYAGKNVFSSAIITDSVYVRAKDMDINIRFVPQDWEVSEEAAKTPGNDNKPVNENPEKINNKTGVKSKSKSKIKNNNHHDKALTQHLDLSEIMAHLRN